MNLNDQYTGACASWVRYSRYEFRQFPDGVRVMPAADAVPQLYNPLETTWEMLAEAMELGRQRRQDLADICLLYTSPSPRDRSLSRMPSSA